MPPPPKMISPICDGVDGVINALLLLLPPLLLVPLLLLVVVAVVAALYLLLLLAAAELPGVQGGRLRVSTACRRLRNGPEFSPCFGEGKINGKCAIVEAVMPLVLPVTLLLLLLLLLPPPNMRSNSLTMESSPSPPPPLPPRKTLSWPSKLKEPNEHMPIDGRLPVELLRLCRGGGNAGVVMAAEYDVQAQGRTLQAKETIRRRTSRPTCSRSTGYM